MLKTYRTHYQQVESFVTLDGTCVRELMHPRRHGNQNLSFAEAQLEAGHTSLLHRHHQTEEIYHFLSASGQMVLGDEVLDVVAGDTVCIPAGVAHSVTNTSDETMRIFCSCSPAYSDEDTEILVGAQQEAVS